MRKYGEIADVRPRTRGYVHSQQIAPGRNACDIKDEESLVCVMGQYNVFSPTSHRDCLCNIATKDLATDEIHKSLLGAKGLGQKQVQEFVKQRLIEPFQQFQLPGD